MQGDFDSPGDKSIEQPAAATKRSRLDAVANNAPWENLMPANDKDTLQRMRRHQEEVAKYSALTEAQRRQVPSVSPYPETPDKVFPGTPCYRITVNGEYVYVFVLEPGTEREVWHGEPRTQSKGYWIVPHFIYRDPNDVETRRKVWQDEYDRSQKEDPKEEPPNKIDFKAGDVQHACYYSPAENNTSTENPPEIDDPLFTITFNNNPTVDADQQKAFPFPYNQNKDEYPVRPAPKLMKKDNNDNRGPLGYHDPHTSLLTVIPPHYKGMPNVDWICQNAKNYEIRADFLRTVCERAEEMDYLFAQSMQGLRGTNISAVWTCTDPEYDITDRATVLAQFVKMYMEKFYTHISVMGSTDVEEVVHEALRLHEEFCKGWVHRHHRTLAPEITAASEALVGMYYEQLQGLFGSVRPTRAQIGRFLRRHPDYCGEFAHCLYHYMTRLEHMRGNRNPSYKAMSNERNAHITALKKMSEMLFNGSNRGKLQTIFRSSAKSEMDMVFDLYFIDWHYIAAQMPQHHKEFDGFTNSFNLYRSRMGGRANAFPPWQQMRMTR